MAERFANTFQTTLTVALTSGATSMTVATTAPVALRSGEARFRIGDELVVATIPANGVSPWTITRGAEGTTAAVHPVHSVFGVVRHVLTAASLAASGAAEATTVLATHTGDATDAHAASAIGFSPTGSIAATTTQAAVAEVATDAAALVTAEAATRAAAVTAEATARGDADTALDTRLDSVESSSGGPGKTGYLSLRNDFALNPSMSAAALETAINSAIVSAISAGKGIDLGADLWPIDGPLIIGGGIALRAAGAMEVWDTVQNSNKTVRPGAAPWVRGGGFVQEAAGEDILRVTATGVTLHLADLQLRFADAIAFDDTGHALYAKPTALATLKPENGLAGCRWDNVVVWGHDGDHYAFYTVNMNLFTATQLRGYGGGGWYEECDSAISVYGNGTLVEPYFCVFAEGTAHGYHMKGSGSAAAGALNLVTMIRPQALMQDVAGTTLAAAYGITGSPQSGVQRPYFDDGIEIYNNCLVAANMEPVSFPCVFAKGTTAYGPEYSSRLAYHNTSYGRYALPGTPTGQFNTGIGDTALTANTTGANNTAVGYQALLANVSGATNTAIGTNALAANTGSSNTAVGANALAANIGGATNTAVGNLALTGNTTGANNVAIGAQALNANVSGGQNTAVGKLALSANTGDNNTAVGASALQGNIGGGNNTAVGYQALLVATTGVGNTAVGHLALGAATTSSANTAVGQGALRNILAGANNTAVGQNALFTPTTAGSNVAVGVQCLFSSTSGSQNVGLGFNALYLNTTGSKNVGLGYGAGHTDGTTATSNNLTIATLLGFNAQATVSRVVVLGSALAAERSSVAIGCVGSAANLGNGVGALIAMQNADTVPNANHPAGGQLYAEAGALKWRGSAGTVTTVAVA